MSTLNYSSSTGPRRLGSVCRLRRVTPLVAVSVHGPDRVARRSPSSVGGSGRRDDPRGVGRGCRARGPGVATARLTSLATTPCSPALFGSWGPRLPFPPELLLYGSFFWFLSLAVGSFPLPFNLFCCLSRRSCSPIYRQPLDPT